MCVCGVVNRERERGGRTQRKENDGGIKIM